MRYPPRPPARDTRPDPPTYDDRPFAPGVVDPPSLAAKANAERELRRSLAMGHAPFEAALGVHCHAHDARTGKPCWSVPGERGAGHPAVCSERVHKGDGSGHERHVELGWQEVAISSVPGRVTQSAARPGAVIDARHSAVALGEEISATLDATYRRIDEARRAETGRKAGRPPARPAPPPGPAVAPQPAVEPGGLVLSAEEVVALDHLLATHPQTRDLMRGKRDG